jgi:nitronate monooxygenase
LVAPFRASPFPKDIGDRVLSNTFNAAWHGQDEQLMAHRTALQEQLNAADQAGDASVSAVRVGNATGLISSVEPASEIVRRIIAEAEAILRSRPQIVLIQIFPSAVESAIA